MDSFKRNSAVVVLFAKAPEPGQVKTRLRPVLSEALCARLQEAFLLDTLHFTDGLPCDRAIACTPTPAHPFFLRCGQERSLTLIPQEGRELGERMRNAFRWGFSQGYGKVILIGCDTPTLPPHFIREGLVQLDRHAWVVGPSRDGGYYLIGARSGSYTESDRPGPDLFSGMAWGTDQVLTETISRLNGSAVRCHLLPFWYDIDRPEDLRFLKTHLQILEADGTALPKETYPLIQKIDLRPPAEGGSR